MNGCQSGGGVKSTEDTYCARFFQWDSGDPQRSATHSSCPDSVAAKNGNILIDVWHVWASLLKTFIRQTLLKDRGWKMMVLVLVSFSGLWIGTNLSVFDLLILYGLKVQQNEKGIRFRRSLLYFKELLLLCQTCWLLNLERTVKSKKFLVDRYTNFSSFFNTSFTC